MPPLRWPAVRVTTASGFEPLAEDAARLGLALTREQVAACEQYAAALIERNEQVNLTAITDPRAIATKHFLDSFTAAAARTWTGGERVVDVGSGAGFPGVALRILLPELRVTLVESVGKKARWLEDAVRALGLGGVAVIQARAEALGADPAHRDRYDVGTARAVGTLGACAEYLLPLLRIGGEALVWKGRLDAELDGARRALAELGGELTAVVPTSAMGVGDVLPGRSVVVMRKVRATPRRYPRDPAEARRRPW